LPPYPIQVTYLFNSTIENWCSLNYPSMPANGSVTQIMTLNTGAPYNKYSPLVWEDSEHYTGIS